MQQQVCSAGGGTGGIAGYPLGELYEEIAFVAFHFPWSETDVMDMEHRDRRRWVAEISKLNRRLSEAKG